MHVSLRGVAAALLLVAGCSDDDRPPCMGGGGGGVVASGKGSGAGADAAIDSAEVPASPPGLTDCQLLALCCAQQKLNPSGASSCDGFVARDARECSKVLGTYLQMGVCELRR